MLRHSCNRRPRSDLEQTRFREAQQPNSNDRVDPSRESDWRVSDNDVLCQRGDLAANPTGVRQFIAGTARNQQALAVVVSCTASLTAGEVLPQSSMDFLFLLSHLLRYKSP